MRMTNQKELELFQKPLTVKAATIKNSAVIQTTEPPPSVLAEACNAEKRRPRTNNRKHGGTRRLKNRLGSPLPRKEHMSIKLKPRNESRWTGPAGFILLLVSALVIGGRGLGQTNLGLKAWLTNDNTVIQIQVTNALAGATY